MRNNKGSGRVGRVPLGVLSGLGAGGGAGGGQGGGRGGVLSGLSQATPQEGK